MDMKGLNKLLTELNDMGIVCPTPRAWNHLWTNIFKGFNEVGKGGEGGGALWRYEDFRFLEKKEGTVGRVEREEGRKVTGWKVTK